MHFDPRVWIYGVRSDFNTVEVGEQSPSSWILAFLQDRLPASSARAELVSRRHYAFCNLELSAHTLLTSLVVELLVSLPTCFNLYFELSLGDRRSGEP